MRALCIALTLAALTVADTLPAQTATPGQTMRTPPRDPRAVTAPAGSGIIRGQVVDATTGAPVRRAIVSIYAAEFRGVRPPNAMTDDYGRFELTDLPAGKHTVSATKPTYISGTYGQTRPRGSGTPIELLAKQVVDKVVIRLSRGGVIVGRVIDESGEPVPQVQVSPMQYRYGPQGRTLSGASGSSNSTDDLGMFRIYGLESGQYYVTARPNQFMGAYNVPAAGIGHAATYFPNAPDPSSAQRVTVAAGRETGPILITLVNTRMSFVRGRAVMSDGQPFVNASVRITRNEGGAVNTSSSSSTTADGSFEVRSLAPGTYHLSIVPMGVRDDEEADIARTTLTVNGDDIDGLFLVAGRTGVARGRVVSDDGSPIKVTNMTVVTNPPTPAERLGMMPSVRVKEDLTFELKGLYGPLLFNAYPAPQQAPGTPPWMLKSVMLNNVDIIDKPLDFQPGMVVDGLELVFTQKAAELSGHLTISGGASLADALVLLFPSDETLWGDRSRFVRVANPDKDGSYRFRVVVPHDDYLLVTALNLEPGQHMDPDFLRSVRESALRISLAEGAKQVQNIRMSAVR